MQLVALKVSNPGAHYGPMLNEYLLTSMLSHPHIIRTHQCFRLPTGQVPRRARRTPALTPLQVGLAMELATRGDLFAHSNVIAGDDSVLWNCFDQIVRCCVRRPHLLTPHSSAPSSTCTP